VVLRSQDWLKSTPKMAAWERLIELTPQNNIKDKMSFAMQKKYELSLS
jgi:hypothetical protein